MPSNAVWEGETQGDKLQNTKKRKRDEDSETDDSNILVGTFRAKFSHSLCKNLGKHEPLVSEKFTIGRFDWVLLFYPDGVQPKQSMEKGETSAEEGHRKQAEELNAPPPVPTPATVPGELNVPRVQQPSLDAPNDMKKPTTEHASIFLANVGEGSYAKGLQRTERGRVIRARHSFTLVSQDPRKQTQSITRGHKATQTFEELLLAHQVPKDCLQQDHRVWMKDPFAGNCFGCHAFVESKFVKKEQFGFVRNDTILIDYEIEILLSESETLDPSVHPEGTDRRSGKHLLKWWKDGRKGGVSFRFPQKNIKPIRAHSCLIDVRFRKHPIPPGLPDIQPSWLVLGISPEVVRCVLSFLYTDSLPEGIHMDKVRDVLAAARKLDLPDLLWVCEDVLAQNLEVDNLAQNLELAHIYNASGLKTACLTFAVEHLPRIMATAGFKLLIARNKKLLEVFLDHVEDTISSNAAADSDGEDTDLDQPAAKKARVK